MRVRGLVTVGPALDPRQFHAPAHVVVRDSVPHSAVFSQAAAVITHAGHGTVIRALACGVPVLCLPMGRAQQDNAARVVARGVGLRLSARASVAALRAAVHCVLDEPRFRTNARQLAAVIAEEARRARAVTELEELAARPR